MSEELIKRLWESDEASALTNEAARRIEALEFERDKLIDEAEDWAGRWGMDTIKLEDDLATSQARLSEAVKVLEMVMKDCEESGMMGLEYAVLDEKTEGAVKAFLATIGEENVR